MRDVRTASRVRVSCAVMLLGAATAAFAGDLQCDYSASPHASIGDAMDDLMAACPPLVGACLGAIDVNAPEFALVKCYGKRKVGGSVPDADTLFRIASVSKVMTGTLFALRVVQQKVSLFAPIDGYTGWGNTHAISLFELATHRSGLPKNPEKISPTTVAKLYKDVHECVADPGGCWTTHDDHRYSNHGFAVLGRIIADVDGLSWEQDNEQNLMWPLGMYSTSTRERLEAHPSGAWSNRATGYVEDEPGHLVQSNDPFPLGMPVTNPMGGLYSSPNDMMQWLSYSMGLMAASQDLRDANEVAQFHWLSGHCNGYTDPPIGPPSCPNADAGTGTHDRMGFAWNHDHDTLLNANVISKDGDLQGFHAKVSFVEGEYKGVVVMVNSDRINDSVLSRKLLHSLP